MFELLLKLVDKFIELARRKEELNQRLFTQHVEPMFAAFEACHADYVASLSAYRRAALEPIRTLGAIADGIESDVAITANFRLKALSFAGGATSPLLMPLATAILRYLENPRETVLADARAEPLSSQRIRTGLVYKLRLLDQDNDYVRDLARDVYAVREFEHLAPTFGGLESIRRGAAVYVFDQTIADLQARYYDVTQQYMAMRQQLLLPPTPFTLGRK